MYYLIIKYFNSFYKLCSVIIDINPITSYKCTPILYNIFHVYNSIHFRKFTLSSFSFIKHISNFTVYPHLPLICAYIVSSSISRVNFKSNVATIKNSILSHNHPLQSIQYYSMIGLEASLRGLYIIKMLQDYSL